MDVILHLGGSGKAAVKTAESAYLAYDDVGIENVRDAIKGVVLTTTTGQPMTIYPLHRPNRNPADRYCNRARSTAIALTL